MPAPADLERQRLAGRNAAAHGYFLLRRHDIAGKEGRVKGRNREEDRHLVFLQDQRHRLRRRPIRQQYRGGADRERERHRVAEPIGEKQLGDRIDHVVLAEAEDWRGVEIVGEPQIGVDVHGRLGLAGRAGGVEPERDVVARGRRPAILMAMRVLAAEDHLQPVDRADQIGELRIELLRHDEHARAAVLEHVAVVILGHQRVDRDGDAAGIERAEEHGWPVDAVKQAHQHPLFRPHLQRLQDVREALGALAQLLIGPRPGLIDIGNPIAPCIVALEDVAREIVGARNGLSRCRRQQSRHCAHSSLPGKPSPLWRRQKTLATRLPLHCSSTALRCSCGPVTELRDRRKGAPCSMIFTSFPGRAHQALASVRRHHHG